MPPAIAAGGIVVEVARYPMDATGPIGYRSGMPADPIEVTLSDGQKVEALKRMRGVYAEELNDLGRKLGEILNAKAEADFLAQYIGEQPEVTRLREPAAQAEKLEKRRQHLATLVDRIDQILGGAKVQPNTIQRY